MERGPPFHLRNRIRHEGVFTSFAILDHFPPTEQVLLNPGQIGESRIDQTVLIGLAHLFKQFRRG